MKTPPILLVVSSLLLLPQFVHADEALGRLFFTPAQRSALDAGKRIMSERKSAPTARGPRRYAVDGIVTRSDGQSTVWLNGKPYYDRAPPGTGMTLRPGKADSVLLKPGAGKKPVEIKVSQQLDRGSGVVTERYQVPPPAKRPRQSKPSTASGAAATSELPGRSDR